MAYVATILGPGHPFPTNAQQIQHFSSTAPHLALCFLPVLGSVAARHKGGGAPIAMSSVRLRYWQPVPVCCCCRRRRRQRWLRSTWASGPLRGTWVCVAAATAWCAVHRLPAFLWHLVPRHVGAKQDRMQMCWTMADFIQWVTIKIKFASKVKSHAVSPLDPYPPVQNCNKKVSVQKIWSLYHPQTSSAEESATTPLSNSRQQLHVRICYLPFRTRTSIYVFKT